MLVFGAGGHAKEVLDILIQTCPKEELFFFDNTLPKDALLWEQFPIISNIHHIPSHQTDFVLGIGNIKIRKLLSSLALNHHLHWKGIRATNASIGNFASQIDPTVDIMQYVTISSAVKIGKGTLLNRYANIHHDVEIGEYCELAPSCQILGNVKIGNAVFVGAGAILLPNTIIGEGAVIGAGAIVHRNVASGATIVGNPGRKIK